MKINLIIVQHQESYPGEYMPNVVDAWDEFTLEDNWDGYRAALAKYEEGVRSGDYAAVREATITISDEQVLGLFETPTLDAKAVG